MTGDRQEGGRRIDSEVATRATEFQRKSGQSQHATTGFLNSSGKRTLWVGECWSTGISDWLFRVVLHPQNAERGFLFHTLCELSRLEDRYSESALSGTHRAQLIDSRYLTSIWYHPRTENRFHGAFQLLLHSNGNEMLGIWTAYDEAKNSVVCGEWKWEGIMDADHARGPSS